MAMITKSINGTQDILPGESAKWKYIESSCFDTAALFGFKEIRTPVFEYTELFQRGVGDTTDVVQKEMYTFNDKGGRSLTLRPELTASAVRASVERGLIFDALPAKLCYCGGCYRSERPQAGRLREFHQFGVELYGASSPAADAEVIRLGASIIEALGIKNVKLEINSIGCPDCRKKYTQALRDYFEPHLQEMCGTCGERFERNPMRLLDCKADCCREIAKDAPSILDYLCEECAAHFSSVKLFLESMDVEYTVNPRIVRGLDYYTRTVFEFSSDELGAQSALGGGGRYDGLFAELGGPDTPAVGFAMGIERLRLVMEAQGTQFPGEEPSLLYLAPVGERATATCLSLCSKLRLEGFSAETDLNGRSVKAQMKYANKRGFRYSCVVGDDELEKGVAKLKEMATGEEREVELGDGLLDAIYDVGLKDALGRFDETMAGINDEALGSLFPEGVPKGEDESAMNALLSLLGGDELPDGGEFSSGIDYEALLKGAEEPYEPPKERFSNDAVCPSISSQSEELPAYDLDMSVTGEAAKPQINEDELPDYDLDLSFVFGEEED